jgi:hypothetical protein
MKLTNSISISGVPGTGKTMATADIVTKLGLQAVVFDFENKFAKTISLYYQEFAEQFEIYSIIQKAQESKTSPNIRAGRSVIQADMKLTFRNAPDYLASIQYLIEKMDEITSRNDFQVLIMDGATPTIRNHLGLAYWKSLHPGREPVPVEWGAMNDIEQSFVDAGIGWAEENNGLFIITGQMKDDYRGDKKVGEVPGISTKCQHSIDVVLELQKKISKDHTDYCCICLDSIKGQWVEQLTLEKHVFEVLLEKELIGYE